MQFHQSAHRRRRTFSPTIRGFARSALSGYTQHDFIALVDSYRIAWHEKTRGQLFCDGSSRQIVDMLLEECRKAQAQLRLGVRISAVSKDESGFVVATDQGEFRAKSLVVATGGPSIPKMGSSGFGYKIAEQFGLKVVPPRAALVPLTFDTALLAKFGDLSGVSVEAVVRCGKARPRYVSCARCKTVWYSGWEASIQLWWNIRIIAATNRNMENMVQCGKFREDLYYRLNVFPVPHPAAARAE